jgi:glucokinase
VSDAASSVLAVDVGGTKLAAAIVEADGRIRARATVETPASKDATVVAAALHEVVDRVARHGPLGRLVGLGIGSAGPVDVAAGTVSPVNIPAWRGFGIVDAMRDVVPGRPTLLAGDGHCMAFGEYWRGGFRSRALLGVVVSTGVGGGLVIDGRIYGGPTGNAGHIGHIVVDIDGPACPCGGRGCVEAYASGPAMVRRARANGWSHSEPDARHLADDARRGHPVARDAFRQAADVLAAAIVTAAALIDLDDVVIGGGVAGAGHILLDPLRASLGERAGLDFIRRVRVHASPLGADAGLLGAAALVLDAARR